MADARSHSCSHDHADAGVGGSNVVCGGSSENVKGIGAESGRDPLDRLLTFAMTAVLITIARHIREPRFATRRGAEIEKVLERFRPYFPWMDQQKISQVAGDGTGDVAKKGGSGPRKQQKPKRPREQGGDTDRQKISQPSGSSTGAVAGKRGSGMRKQQKPPLDQGRDADQQKISQAAGDGTGAVAGKGGSGPRKQRKRTLEHCGNMDRQKKSQAAGGGTAVAEKGGSRPRKQQKRLPEQGGGASVTRDGQTRATKQLKPVSYDNEGAREKSVAKENVIRNGDNEVNPKTDSLDTHMARRLEPGGAATRSEGRSKAGDDAEGVGLSVTLENGLSKAWKSSGSHYLGLHYEEINALHRIQAVPIPWRERIATLRSYYEKHGHLNIKPSDPELGRDYSKWLKNRRADAHFFEKTGKSYCGLNASRIAELRSIGFEFGPDHTLRFERMFIELEKYIKENGHCNFPRCDNSDLGKWVKSVRGQYYRLMRGSQVSPNLTASQIARLTKIGLTFPKFNTMTNFPKRRSWEEWMEICKKFSEENGHLKIPRAHPTLGGFSSRLRAAYKKKEEEGTTGNFLTDERLRELDDMGFVWFVRPSRDQDRKGFGMREE